jgi:hypothetical protein
MSLQWSGRSPFDFAVVDEAQGSELLDDLAGRGGLEARRAGK